MDASVTVAAVIFLVTYALIATDRINKTIAALLGASAATAWSQSPPEAAPAAAAPSAPAPTTTAPAKPAVDPSAPKPFSEVTKDAKSEGGLFPIWRKDEKVWIEIPRAMLNKPVLFTVNIANSVGERGLYASQMGRHWMAEFRLTGKQVQLIALNTKFRAASGAGSKRAIEQAFSPSLLGFEHLDRAHAFLDAAHPRATLGAADRARAHTDTAASHPRSAQPVC